MKLMKWGQTLPKYFSLNVGCLYVTKKTAATITSTLRVNKNVMDAWKSS
jgi:hypothetical protein